MKKPNVFVNKIDHKLNNNEDVFTSYRETKDDFNDVFPDKNLSQADVRLKIKKIFASPRYVYKADTIIKTKEKTIEATIVGVNNDRLLTIDNQIIEIRDILDIEMKN